MLENRKMIICICCPLGCEVSVKTNDDCYEVENNKCIKGYDYVITELTNPVRYVTSSITLNNNPAERLPVRTSLPIPKSKIFQVMNEIKLLRMRPPIYAGQVLIKDVVGTGSDIIASDSYL